MTDYLDQIAHAALGDDIAAGRIEVSLPRTVAKEFFLRVSLAEMRDTGGENPWSHKIAILAGQAIAPLLLLLVCGLLVLDLGWLAAVFVPLTGAFWTIVAGLTNPRGHWMPLTGLLVLATIGMLADLPWFSHITLFVLSLWVHQMTLLLAAKFLAGFVVKSFAAYEMLAPHVTITSASDH